MSFSNLSWGTSNVGNCFDSHIVGNTNANVGDTTETDATDGDSSSTGYCYLNTSTDFSYTAGELFDLSDAGADGGGGYTIQTTLPYASDAFPQITYDDGFISIDDQGVVLKYLDGTSANTNTISFYSKNCASGADVGSDVDSLAGSGHILSMVAAIRAVFVSGGTGYNDVSAITEEISLGDDFTAIHNDGTTMNDVELVLPASAASWTVVDDGHGADYCVVNRALAIKLDSASVTKSGEYTINNVAGTLTLKLTIPKVLVLYHPERITLTLSTVGNSVAFDGAATIAADDAIIPGSTTPNSFTVTIEDAWAVRTLKEGITVTASGGGNLFVDGDPLGTTKGKIVIGDVTVSDDVGSADSGTITYTNSEIPDWDSVLTGNLQFTMDLSGVQSSGTFKSTSGSGQINITVTQN